MLRQGIRRSVTLLGVVLPQRRTSTERCRENVQYQKTIISWTFACRFKFIKFIYWRVSKWVVNLLLHNFFGSLNKQALLVGCWRSSISTWEAYEETCWFQEAPLSKATQWFLLEQSQKPIGLRRFTVNGSWRSTKYSRVGWQPPNQSFANRQPPFVNEILVVPE